MQHFSEREIKICKGIAVLFVVLYGLFSANAGLIEKYGINNFFLIIYITSKIGDFCWVGAAIFIFLAGFELDKYYKANCFEDKKIGKLSCQIYLKLLYKFFPLYILVAATSFLGRDIHSVYGTHIKKWVYAVIDVLGLSGVFSTPTLNPAWVYISILAVYILLAPLMIELYQKYRFAVCIIAVAIPYVLGVDKSFWNYLGVFMLGICCAEDYVFERLKRYVFQDHKTGTMYAKLLISLGSIGVANVIVQNVGLNRVMRCFIVVGIIYFAYEFISDVKWIGDIFAFLGKHSFNVWLICDMLYLYYFKEQIFALHYSILIFAVVLAGALLISIFLELVKEKSGYNRMVLGKNSNACAGNVKYYDATSKTCRNALSRLHMRVICVLHFCIGLWYMLFHIINIRNMDTTVSLQVLDSNISDSLERFLFLIISVIIGGVLIYAFWKIVFIFCQKWEQIAGKKMFFICLLVGIVAIILIYPGMYAYEIDNYITYRYAMISYPFYWHGAYTSYFYLACHMFLPHPISIPLVQFTSFLLVIFYAYNMSHQEDKKKWSMLYFLLLAVPEALYVALNPYRNCFYTILCLGLLVYVYFEYKQQKKLSRIKFMVLLALFAFTAVWRSEGIIFSVFLFTALMFLAYRQRVTRIVLGLFLLLLCIKLFSIPQDLGSKKYWGSDYTIINCMNSLQVMLNADNANLQYEGAESDLEAIETITPVEMIKESGIWGYRNYNQSCGRSINQSCASTDEQRAFLKAYAHITFYNLPVFLESKLQDYKTILFQRYPKSVSSYEGDFYVFPKGKFKNQNNAGYALIENSYGTKTWEASAFRNKMLSVIDAVVYAYFWLGTKLGLTVAVRIWLYAMFCVCLLLDFMKSIAKRSREYVFRFLIEAAIFVEYCAIVLVMPEPRAAYFYPMQFCIYFMVLSKICDWLRSEEKQKKQKGIEEVKQEQGGAVTH